MRKCEFDLDKHCFIQSISTAFAHATDYNINNQNRKMW